MTNTKTPAQLRAEAAQHDQDAHDSFERCDTDGFLSQWASGLTAQQKRLAADLVEAGGVTRILGPVTLDGEPVRWRMVNTKFGYKWLVLDDHDDAVAWLNPFAVNTATLRKKGYNLGEYEVPAKADIVGTEATNCRAAIVPIRWTTDVADDGVKLVRVADESITKSADF